MKNNLLDYFIITSNNYPNKIAVIEGDNQITFNKLKDQSFCVASHILKFTKELNKPIAVLLPKTIESIVSDLAITISGNIYMNLDIKNPSERLKNILETIKPILVITNSYYFDILREIYPLENIINIDSINYFEKYDYNLIYNRIERQIDTDPYCIINTSGSTGTPKGVVLNHRGFIDFIEVSNEIFKFSNEEIIGSLSPLVFDIYSFELCMMMSKSSTIVLIPDNYSAFPIKIIEILRRLNVSFLFWVPTIMVNIANLNLLENNSLKNLNLIWFAGEVFPTKQFNYWKKSLPKTIFANLYGPIEITLDCTYFIVNREFEDNEALPIGFPYRNTDILILNDSDNLVQGNEEGELCVRGTSLAMGYYNNPEKTASAFVQNPLNNSYPEIIYRTGDIVSFNELGEIVFKGRKDSLIKHLGYRIELGEIEHVIVNVLKLVRNACVVYQTVKKEITLFYEADEEISLRYFREKISQELPKYMIPTVYYRLNELPRNTNGKIDRLYLKNQINK